MGRNAPGGRRPNRPEFDATFDTFARWDLRDLSFEDDPSSGPFYRKSVFLFAGAASMVSRRHSRARDLREKCVHEARGAVERVPFQVVSSIAAPCAGFRVLDYPWGET
ncbi:hypothetical protein TNCT_483281 [Trichonephila clavata]|uniref:Uncharacterized protein n=1 Tax=Trichonephila clavata TaxID=2740835 RepID=A0A8X6KA97_TRICU|nr:hypothetical protein TNCT_483281 [Trichonephila clavata]